MKMLQHKLNCATNNRQMHTFIVKHTERHWLRPSVCISMTIETDER